MSVHTTCPFFLAFGITQHFACCRTALGAFSCKLTVISIFTHPVNKGQVQIYWPCQCRNLQSVTMQAAVGYSNGSSPLSCRLKAQEHSSSFVLTLSLQPAVQHLAPLSQHTPWVTCEPDWPPHQTSPVYLVSSCHSFSLHQLPSLALCTAAM